MSSAGSVAMIQVLNWNREKIASTRSESARLRSWVMAILVSKSLSRIRKQYAFLFILNVVLSSVSIPASAQEVWMSAGGSTVSVAAPQSTSTPMPQIWFSLGGMGKPETYQSWNTLFFEPNAPWPEFMNHVRAVGVLTQVLAQISDADLTKVVARLKEKHIALGIEMLAQAYDPPGCGGGVEGYFPTDQVRALAAKLKRAGAEVNYIAMDEPLWFGHYYDGPHACHSSIGNVADRVAENLHEYLKVFPNAIVGDGEPFPAITNQPGWREDYQQWMEAVHAKTGKTLAFTDVDINWGHTDWPESLRTFASFARDVHMQVGIIYNAAPPNKTMTSQQWLDDAVHKFTYIEKTLGITPNWGVFSSWVKFPGRAIAVPDGLGEDYLVKQYLKLHGVPLSDAKAAIALSMSTPAGAEPEMSKTIFEQPELTGVPGNFFVPSSSVEKNKYPTSPPFKLIFWQGNPFQPNGEFVPSAWDAKTKTGLDVGEDQSAQYSLKSSGSSSTVQIKGSAVGAYLNSADLMNSRFQADPAMMITPVFDEPEMDIFPFSDSKQKLYESLNLRIPTAVSQARPHNIVYVVSDFTFIDRTTGAKLTYEIALFHQDPHAPQLTREGLVATEVGPFDAGSHSYQVGNPLTPLSRLMDPVENSALYSNLPWREERRIAFTISGQNFKTGLESLKAKIAYKGSLNPADYALRQWHLNAEMQYDQTPTQLGWSLSDTKLVLIKDARAK